MAEHTHQFVETYDDLVGFGLNRPTNENTVIYYLQKFSDDRLLKTLIKRLSNEELEALFEMMTATLKRHLSESEYHRLFLKDDHP